MTRQVQGKDKASLPSTGDRRRAVHNASAKCVLRALKDGDSMRWNLADRASKDALFLECAVRVRRVDVLRSRAKVGRQRPQSHLVTVKLPAGIMLYDHQADINQFRPGNLGKQRRYGERIRDEKGALLRCVACLNW